MDRPTAPAYTYNEYLDALETSQSRLEFVDGLSVVCGERYRSLCPVGPASPCKIYIREASATAGWPPEVAHGEDDVAAPAWLRGPCTARRTKS